MSTEYTEKEYRQAQQFVADGEQGPDFWQWRTASDATYYPSDVASGEHVHIKERVIARREAALADARQQESGGAAPCLLEARDVAL